MQKAVALALASATCLRYGSQARVVEPPPPIRSFDTH
jgi:hypothetical protein